MFLLALRLVACTDPSYGPGPALPSSAASLGEADLRIEPCEPSPAGIYNSGIDTSSDFDGDGAYDLAIGVPGYDGLRENSGAVYVLSNPTASSVVDISAAVATILLADDFYGGLGARVSHVGDLDGDGLDELYVEDGGGGYVFRGSTLSGTLTTDEAMFRVPRGSQVLGDLDGDGHLEMAGAEPDNGEAGASVQIIGATFETFVLWGQSGLGDELAVVSDQDGDGVGDLALTAGDDLLVFGSASLEETYTMEALPHEVYVGFGCCALAETGDVNGDGKNDLYSLRGRDLGFLPRSPTGGDLAVDGRMVDLEAMGLSPESVASAPDLGGDGVADLWIGGTEASALFDARDLWEDGGAAIAVAEIDIGIGSDGAGWAVDPQGAVWLAVVDDDAETWARFVPPLGAELSIADAATTVSGFGWSWSTDAFHVRDLDGDGLTDLVLTSGRHALVFPGTTLADGGTLAMCDAPRDLWLDGEIVGFLPDMDANGAEEVLIWNGHDVARWDARGFMETARDYMRLGELEADTLSPPLCDLDGDGLPELGITAGTRTYLASGASWHERFTGAELAGILRTEAPGPFSALSDLGGDGVCEIGALGNGLALLDSASLGTATELLLTLDASGPPISVEDIDGDGYSELLAPCGVAQACVFRSSEIRAGASDATLLLSAPADTTALAITDGGARGPLFAVSSDAGAELYAFASDDLASTGEVDLDAVLPLVTFESGTIQARIAGHGGAGLATLFVLNGTDDGDTVFVYFGDAGVP